MSQTMLRDRITYYKKEYMSDLTSAPDPMNSDFHFKLPKSLVIRLNEISRQNAIKKSQLMRLILTRHLSEYAPQRFKRDLSNEI